MVNSFLPEKVKVLDCIKVTRGFNAKNNCNRRQYVYIAPSFLFADKTTELRRPLSKEQLEQKLSDHVSEGLIKHPKLLFISVLTDSFLFSR